MSDIFISYARSTEAHAQRIADALRALGYGVWRDDELPAHRGYGDVIEERLAAAKAVLVIWSADAVKSEWVRSEANRAREDRKLVQLSVDGVRLPMPFDQIQCADLAGWAGETDAAAWRKVVSSVEALVRQAAPDALAGGRGAPGVRALSVCVLPFANMSGDAEQEYFSDGISEDIITDLSKVSALSVVSRNSAFQFKGRHVDVRQVARQLGVSHVLEGSVRKAGNRVRITAQLIEGAGDSHVWAERYDRDLTDIFALQDEISQAIVAALRLKLLPAEKAAIERRGTANPDAYNLYLKARQRWVGGNNDRHSLEEVARLARRAVDIDADYALAWAQLAMAHGALHFRHGLAADEGLAAAEQALALDANLAEAHAVKARFLSGNDRFAEADAEIEIALRLDPDSYEAQACAGYVFFRQRRLEDAARHYERASALVEAAYHTASMLLSCYAGLGDQPRRNVAARMSLARAERAVAQDPSNGQAAGCVAGALAALGEGDKAREWVARALRIDPQNGPMRYNLACSLVLDLHDADSALELLGPYLASATPAEIGHALADPDLDPLRGDARYQALIAAAKSRLGV
jgi:adenylate cyclase